MYSSACFLCGIGQSDEQGGEQQGAVEQGGEQQEAVKSQRCICCQAVREFCHRQLSWRMLAVNRLVCACNFWEKCFFVQTRLFEWFIPFQPLFSTDPPVIIVDSPSVVLYPGFTMDNFPYLPTIGAETPGSTGLDLYSPA